MRPGSEAGSAFLTDTAALPLKSVWMDVPLPGYGPLDRDLQVDVVVVGGGLTGITTACLLGREGVRVALVEKGRVASADTGRSTAHLTYVTDDRLSDLAERFGKDGAQAYWQGGSEAIELIAGLARATQARCGFEFCPGFLHAPQGQGKDEAASERALLERDAALAQELGFAATFVESAPFAGTAAVRVDRQARFHPRHYLAALLRNLPPDCPVFEQTRLDDVVFDPMTVLANGHRIRCDYLVVATHAPIMFESTIVPRTPLDPRLALYTSYVLGASLAGGKLPDALFWDTAEPYTYLRVDSGAGFQYLIYGGADVRTGQEQTPVRVFDRLAAELQQKVPGAQVTHKWSGQVVVTDDGLPFIGERCQREFIATGFCGNGFTLGTLAAMMARDRYLGRSNPWFELFRADRPPLQTARWRAALARG